MRARERGGGGRKFFVSLLMCAAFCPMASTPASFPRAVMRKQHLKGGGLPQSLSKCANWHLRVHAGAWGFMKPTLLVTDGGGKFVWRVWQAQLAFCLQGLLPPPGVPLMPCFAFSHSHDSEVWRLPTTTDVGNVQGQGVRITE